MLMVAPLLSIIIVVFREREELAAILESIAPFARPELEVVVIDGGSEDGTAELLEAYVPPVDFWCSEADRGVYDAMNKGLAASHGEYILHLNAGDRLLQVPWELLRDAARRHTDVICCRVLLDGEVEFVSRTTLLSRIDNTWHHQGTFYRRAIHLGYDVSYRTHADFDHNQRLLLRGCKILKDDTLVASHRGDGLTALGTGREEVYRSVRANFGLGYLLVAKLRFALMGVRRLLLQKKVQY